jgi:hypothetical protein
MVGTLILWFVAAAPVPEGLQAWYSAFAKYYGHYHETQAGWEPQVVMGGVCAPADAACEAALLRGPSLFLQLKPQDQRLYAPLVIRAMAVPEAEQKVATLLEHGVHTNRSWQVLVPVSDPAGDMVIELSAPCSVGGVFHYDLEDFVLAIESKVGAKSPAWIALSPCARSDYTRVERQTLRDRAAEPRELFGINFPEARTRAPAQ